MDALYGVAVGVCGDEDDRYVLAATRIYLRAIKARAVSLYRHGPSVLALK